jgi:hypothetical protein
MTFNLSQLYTNLKQNSEGSESNSQGSGRKYPYRMVFVKPNDSVAKLNVRVLFNNNGNSVTFPYLVHKFETGKKLLCGKNNQNNQVCELCDAIKAKKSLSGQDSKEKVQVMTMMFAQFVSATGYVWTTEWPKPEVGDIIIVGGPSSLHSQISEMLVTVGLEHLPEILTDVKGKQIVIGRDSSGKSVIVTPTYSDFVSAKSQEHFNAMIAELPTLESIALFGGMTDADRQNLHVAAEAVNNSFQVKPKAPNTTQPSVDESIQNSGSLGTSSTAPSLANKIPSVGEPTLKITDAATTTQPGYYPEKPPISKEVEDRISAYCREKFDEKNPICQMCLAADDCPYKVPLLDISSDALPF